MRTVATHISAPGPVAAATHISAPGQAAARRGYEPAPPYPGMKPGGIAERAWRNVMRSAAGTARVGARQAQQNDG
jgi:hypothetical protein